MLLGEPDINIFQRVRRCHLQLDPLQRTHPHRTGRDLKLVQILDVGIPVLPVCAVEPDVNAADGVRRREVGEHLEEARQEAVAVDEGERGEEAEIEGFDVRVCVR